MNSKYSHVSLIGIEALPVTRKKREFVETWGVERYWSNFFSSACHTTSVTLRDQVHGTLELKFLVKS